jgi:hypothetical protein
MTRGLPFSDTEVAFRFVLVLLPSAVDSVGALETEIAKKPISAVHLGQNHSPSGMACSGGSRQPRW